MSETQDKDVNKRDRIVGIVSSVIEKVNQNDQLSLNCILGEIRELMLVIEETRKDLGMARPADIKGKHIPGATDELDAIVDATSEATSTIMDCCDKIQGHAGSVDGEHGAAIMDETMKIFEACSFQDITGQRVSKVVQTFHDIEEKIDRLVDVLGIKAATDLPPEEDEREGDERLMNGPQMAEQALLQDDIDKLLAEFDEA